MAKASKKKAPKTPTTKYVQPATFEDKQGVKKTISTTGAGSRKKSAKKTAK